MEKFDLKKFFAGFGSITGWFKALAIGVRVAVILATVFFAMVLVNKVRAMFKPKQVVQSQSQMPILTGNGNTITMSQPVNVDYVKIADIVESKQKKYYAGFNLGLNPEKASDKYVGVEAGINF